LCVPSTRERSPKKKKMIEIRPTAEILHFAAFFYDRFSRVCNKGKGARGSRAGVDALSMVQRKSQFSLGLHCIKIQISFREQRRAHDVIKATPFSTFIRVHPHNVIFFE
jgi:hypothetical protein